MKTKSRLWQPRRFAARLMVVRKLVRSTIWRGMRCRRWRQAHRPLMSTVCPITTRELHRGRLTNRGSHSKHQRCRLSEITRPQKLKSLIPQLCSTVERRWALLRSTRSTSSSDQSTPAMPLMHIKPSKTVRNDPL